MTHQIRHAMTAILLLHEADPRTREGVAIVDGNANLQVLHVEGFTHLRYTRGRGVSCEYEWTPFMNVKVQHQIYLLTSPPAY